MEDNLLEHRIRLIQHIQDTWRDSGNRRSLVRILADHTFGMTREELQEFLEGSIAPKLEQAWIDLEESRAREEERARDLERERESRKKAEKEASDKEKEIAALRKALEDERNRNRTHVRNRFGSSSRRSRTAKGMSGIASDRTQEKSPLCPGACPPLLTNLKSDASN